MLERISAESIRHNHRSVESIMTRVLTTITVIARKFTTELNLKTEVQADYWRKP